MFRSVSSLLQLREKNLLYHSKKKDKFLGLREDQITQTGETEMVRKTLSFDS